MITVLAVTAGPIARGISSKAAGGSIRRDFRGPSAKRPGHAITFSQKPANDRPSKNLELRLSALPLLLWPAALPRGGAGGWLVASTGVVVEFVVVVAIEMSSPETTARKA